MQDFLVEMKNISKNFGGIHAVDNVTAELRKGEVLGILGHNGAGKSTLMKVLSGAYKADQGSIFINGNQVTINNPRDAQSYGIETLYQNLALADNLDAVQNIFLARERLTRFGTLDNELMEIQAREIIKSVNPNFTAIREPVHRLSGGQRQSIAIARALFFNAKILIMDEPTAALGHKESALFKELVGRLKSQGIGIFMISHDLHEVFELSDTVLVMSNGKLVGQSYTSQISKDELLSMIISGKKGN